jgi:hypothetical protein
MARPAGTGTGHGLSVAPLPIWATSLWCSGRDSSSQQYGSRPHASTSCATRTLVGSRGFEPRRFQWNTGATARRFRPLSQLPKRELSKIWRKAGDSNAYVPRDPGLADQWDTNYPSLPGTKFKLDLKGNYRLGERHQERPAKSRYDRRPRLKKRRIYIYSTGNARLRQGAFAVRADRATSRRRATRR